MRAVSGCRRGKLAQRTGIAATLDDHIARALEETVIDQYVARQQQPRATRAPLLVKPHIARRDAAFVVGKALSHGGLGDPVVQNGAAGERQGIGQANGHMGLRDRVAPVHELLGGRKMSNHFRLRAGCQTCGEPAQLIARQADHRAK